MQRNKETSYLKILPQEIIDMIFMYTDIDTMILFNRSFCIKKYLTVKKKKKKFNWVEAAEQGKIHWMEYMLANGIRTTHSGTLLQIALLHGNIECAQWIWNHGKAIRHLLYTNTRQRNYNKLATTETLGKLLQAGRKQEALWLLTNTTVPYCLRSIHYLIDSDSINSDIVERMLTLQRFAKDDDVLSVFILSNVRNQIQLRCEMMQHIHDGDFAIWWSHHRYDMYVM